MATELHYLPDDGTAALKEDDVAPAPVHLAKPLAGANDPESGFGMERQAGGVFGEDSGLKGPDARTFSFSNEMGEKFCADSSTARNLRDIDAYFSDTGIDAAARYGGERSPTQDLIAIRCDRPASLQMALIPLTPLGCGLLKGGVSGSNAFEIDGADSFPMGCGERNDGDHVLMIANDWSDMREYSRPSHVHLVGQSRHHKPYWLKSIFERRHRH